MPISWGPSSGFDQSRSLPMQDSSAENLLSLSTSSPITSNESPEKAAVNGNGSHHVTKAFDSVVDTFTKPSKKPPPYKSTESVARTAKREISEKVREDWTWSPTNSTAEASPSELDDTREWRERESDSEYSRPSPVVNADPYRFDSPESIERPVFSKKRKRRLLLEEEMQWNDGLRTFYDRRNAWAGAKTRQPSPQPKLDSDSPQPPTPSMEGTQLPTPPSSIPPPPSDSSSPSPTVLIPVAPPVLPPDNPIRASIQPATYPSIYDKIIVRGLSPTIPINLKDVVHALVAGWKKDGEWPPKSEAEKAGAVQEVGARGEGKRLARKSVGRVKKALGLGRGIDDPGRGEGAREE